MKKMTANEIRQTWLNFWKERGHDIEPSASLIPNHDPTLLWINAGVAALKKYFDGSEIPSNRRITNVQKSLRTNDIENVGLTARHHTFFEMMGNFSIGDYFRNEVIPWAYELLTSEKYFGFDKDRLYITHHPDDVASRDLWIKCGVKEDHLIPLEDNFWCIGEGPCGPDTEIFFDRGEKYDPEHIGLQLLKEDIENDRYIEIWNIVFSQYNAQEGVERKDYKELPHKNIDTGAGLERFACILQGTETNFETDLFMPIIRETEKLSKVPYDAESIMAYHVIADHIRTCTFALSDGASFANEGRGYVLRRILRRAMRYGRKLGIYTPFLSHLVDTVVEMMKDFYPYLMENSDRVKKMILSEEERFLKTLSSGEVMLRKQMENTHQLSGEDAFRLYDTYGFPIELTIEIAHENQVEVDLDGFHEEMEKQKQRARSARGDLQSMNRQSADLMACTDPSQFVYDSFSLSAKVIALFQDGMRVSSLDDEGDVMLDQTCFYAESGGQVADRGTMENDAMQLEVLNVQKAPNHQHLHHVHVLYGSLKEGDSVVCSIDQKKRLDTMKNHSSAHLLQKALIEVLGNHVHQEGSYVDDEVVRFDFSHSQKLSEHEWNEIEMKVNQWIHDSIEQKTLLLPIEEAKKTGAMALFDEKYGDIVRVVTFGDVSKEFCGGTHVNNSADIGAFAIEYEESIASGIRRIQARTGIHAYHLWKQKENLLMQIKDQLHGGSIYEIQDRLKSVLHERDDYKEKNARLLEKEAMQEAKELSNQFVLYNGFHLLTAYINDTDRNGLLKRMDYLKTCYDDDIILLIGEKDNQIPILCHVSTAAQKEGIRAGNLVKEVAKVLQGSGGGKPDMASGGGKDKTKIPEALSLVKQWIG